MTPDEARALLDNFDRLLPFEAELEMEGAAKDMAAMVAGMREEWGVRLPDGQLVGAGWGTYDTAQEDQRAWIRDGYDARIVRRYVTTEEEV